MLQPKDFIRLLSEDGISAIGCPESRSIAFCAATAGTKCPGPVREIHLEVGKELCKNGVFPDNTLDTELVLNFAAALGALLTNPEKQLELLEDLDGQIMQKALQLVMERRVTVTLNEKEQGIYADCTLTGTGGTARCVVRDTYTGVVSLRRNGISLLEL